MVLSREDEFIPHEIGIGRRGSVLPTGPPEVSAPREISRFIELVPRAFQRKVCKNCFPKVEEEKKCEAAAEENLFPVWREFFARASEEEERPLKWEVRLVEVQ